MGPFFMPTKFVGQPQPDPVLIEHVSSRSALQSLNSISRETQRQPNVPECHVYPTQLFDNMIKAGS
jgi:hypothetical protein